MEKNITQIFETYPLEINIAKYFIFLLIISFALLFVYGSIKKFSLKLSLLKINRKEKVKVDFSNPKKAAYTVTYLIHRYETPYNEQLLKRLEKHKYRKKVSNFDAETKELIKKFMEYIKLNDV